jgi:sugar fermentation stimulation protein A
MHKPEPTEGLAWPKLLKGTLIRRYQRFKADVKLRNGHVVTVLCPNSGSMKTCSEPGRPVYISRSTNPKRRLKYTWELIEMPSSLVGVNTQVPNRLVKTSIEKGLMPEFQGYDTIRSEVKYGKNSRIDILLENADGKRCYIEVKNCTLVTGEISSFPDAVTERGRKHLKELQDQVALGYRSVNFFLVQRMDAELFRPADHIDEAYGKELRRAAKKGVEIMAYDVTIDLKGIALNRPIPCEL